MINLFVNYFKHPNEKRQKEIGECLEINKTNNQISKIYFSKQDRPTFKEFFELVNEVTGKGDINILANADIFFKDLSLLVENLKHNECYALGRWEIMPNGVEVPFGRNDSQDVWCFKGKVKKVKDCDFFIGVSGSDNAICERLFRSGYVVKNPSVSIRVYHKHESCIRIGNSKEIVHKPYLLIQPHQIQESPIYIFKKMLIVTSLSKNHYNCENQKEAIKSWTEFGDLYSLNTKEEIPQLYNDYKGITFVETDKTVNDYFGKPLISINAIIDFAKEKRQDLALVNSDIIIKYLPILKQDGITIISRYDYDTDIESANLFVHGFDFFHIPYKLLGIFPPFIYGLGNTWWDFSLAYRPITKNIPVYWSDSKYIFHKKHIVHYVDDEREKISKFFRWEFNINDNVTTPQLTNSIIFAIKNKAIKI